MTLNAFGKFQTNIQSSQELELTVNISNGAYSFLMSSTYANTH